MKREIGSHRPPGVLPVETFNSDNAFIVGGPGSLTSLVT